MLDGHEPGSVMMLPVDTSVMFSAGFFGLRYSTRPEASRTPPLSWCSSRSISSSTAAANRRLDRRSMVGFRVADVGRSNGEIDNQQNKHKNRIETIYRVCVGDSECDSVLLDGYRRYATERFGELCSNGGDSVSILYTLSYLIDSRSSMKRHSWGRCGYRVTITLR